MWVFCSRGFIMGVGFGLVGREGWKRGERGGRVGREFVLRELGRVGEVVGVQEVRGGFFFRNGLDVLG